MSETPGAPWSPPDRSRGIAFARLLDRRCSELGLTRDGLVEKSGVTRATIYRWLSGQIVNPRPDQVRAVSRALGIQQQEALLALGYLMPDDLTQDDLAAA